MRARRIIVFLVATAAVVFFAASSLLADGQFKRFPETISPDGAYVLAWAPSTEQPQNTAEFTEVPYEDEAFDDEQPDQAVNYLVDVATHKVVATIPDFGYFCGPKWRQNRHDLEIGWAPDARSALAIYQGRWSSEGVAWIEPRTRKIVDVSKQLADAFRSVLRKREPKLAKQVEIFFAEAVIPANDILIVNASGNIPKEDETALYQLKFKTTGVGEQVRFQLQNARVIKEGYTAQSEDPEGELNKVYGRLRTKLPEARRTVLRDEQKKWLELREGITNDNCKADFTRHRITELRVRLEEQ